MNNKNNEINEANDQVTLILDDNTELLCDVIAIFPVNIKNTEQTYIALLPADADEDSDIYLYRFIDHGEDDIEILNIDDEDEFEAVSDAFDELLDEDEFNEMFDGEEYDDEE